MSPQATFGLSQKEDSGLRDLSSEMEPYFQMSRRRRLEIIRAQLEIARRSWESFWEDLDAFILPGRYRYSPSDDDKGDRRNQKIIDSTATLAARDFSSNVMAGYTSPARIWFRLTTNDPLVAEQSQNKTWLHEVTRLMSAAMLRSNLYDQAPIAYEGWATFGTTCVFLEEDPQRVIHHRVLPVGSFWIGNDELGRPRVFMRKFRLTIRQMLEKFGERDQRTKRITDWSNFSDYVREQWRVGQTETRVEIIHFVMPNDDFNPYYEDSQSKPFASYYYESGISETQAGSYDTGGGDSDRLLRQSGYDYFPALVIRFKTTEGDSYGIDCPGMTCLGDVKQLQIMHKRKAQAIEKIVNPPMNAPGTMKSVALTTLPGKTNYLNARAGEQGFSPAYQITFDVRQIENDISQTQLRINRSYYNNYFFATINDFRNQRATAREVDERSDEKIAAVGPLLEKLNWEWADALVDIWFQVMYRQGKLPPAPEGLRGEILKVEYISIMAQAQKQLGVGTLERFAGFIGPFAQVYPSIADKINSDEFIDEYADSMGVSPRIIRSIEEVEQIRLDRQEQIEQQQALEASSMAAKTAKDLGSAELTENNILGRLANSAA